MYREVTQQQEDSIQEETVIVMVLEDHIETGDLLIEGDILTEVGDPLTEEDTWWRTPDGGGPPGGGYPNGNGRPPGGGGYPGGEPPDGGGPLDLLVDKDHQALKDHLDQ